MLAQFMPAFYVAALYGVSRLAATKGNPRHASVIDVLLVNWAVCDLATYIISGPRLPAAFLCIDIASALWLALRVRGAVSGVAEIFYIALILFNTLFFFASAFDAWVHWVGLSILSWGQLGAVSGGIMRNDLVEIARRAGARLGLRRFVAVGNEETDK